MNNKIQHFLSPMNKKKEINFTDKNTNISS